MGLFVFFLYIFFQNLIKNLPEQKELSNLAELKNEYEELCESEQFGIVVSTEIVPKITRIAPGDFYTFQGSRLNVYKWDKM